MYINVCIDTYTQAYTKADTQAYIRIYIHAYAWGYTLIHAHAYIQGYVHMYTYVYTKVGRGGFMRWYVGSHPCGHPGVYGHTDAWMGPSGCIHRGVLARKYRRTGISRWENRYGNREIWAQMRAQVGKCGDSWVKIGNK